MQAPNLLPEELRKKEEELEKRKIKPETEEIKLNVPDKLNIPKKEIENNRNAIGFFDGIKSFFLKKPKQKLENTEIKSIEQRTKLKNEESFKEKASLLASAPLPLTFFRKKVRGLPKIPAQKIEHKLSEAPKIIKEKEENEEQISRGLEINLIPEEMRSFVRPTKQIKTLWKVLIGSVIILIIFCGGLIFYKSDIVNQIQNFQNQIKKLDNELANYSEFKEQEQILQTRIKSTQKLIDTHIYWTDILSFLEDTIIKDITYTALNCSLDSSQKNNDNKNELIAKINIEGVGKDFAAIKNQLLTFQKSENFVKTVEISELLSTKEQKKKKELKELKGIGFKIDIELQPGILQHTF
ncbi:hypothetical protein HY750_03745 [Candidatus Kuenenbacteria bacterium]|nr:hypothetical protein [Candidatus Kuenenbacteria bacterium]